MTEPKDRARRLRLIGAAFGMGFIMGAGAERARASAIRRRCGRLRGDAVATLMAWFWLPETVHRSAAGTGMPFRNLAEMMRRPGLRRMLDRLHLLVRLRHLPDDVRARRRPPLRLQRVQTGYFFAAFGISARWSRAAYPADRAQAGRQANLHPRGWCAESA